MRRALPVKGAMRASRPEYAYSDCLRDTAPRGRLLQGAVRLLGLLHALDQPPPLGGRRRPGLHDLHAVTDAGDVVLVVGLQLARAADDLAVEAVLHTVLDLDDDGLLHLVADHEALTDLAVATA